MQAGKNVGKRSPKNIPESESLNKMQQKSLWISAESKLFTKYAQAFMEMPLCIRLFSIRAAGKGGGKQKKNTET
jgi:hypothetical protein